MSTKGRKRILKALDASIAAGLNYVAISTKDLVDLAMDHVNQKEELIIAKRELNSIRRKVNGRRPKAVQAAPLEN